MRHILPAIAMVLNATEIHRIISWIRQPERICIAQHCRIDVMDHGFKLLIACPKARAWLFNDLAKSDYAMPAPQAYLDALKKSAASSSVIESLNSTQAQLIMKTEQLKKSLEDFLRKGMTSIKCQQCSTPTKFFKVSTPNRCSSCDAPFSMSAIWKSWNK